MSEFFVNTKFGSYDDDRRWGGYDDDLWYDDDTYLSSTGHASDATGGGEDHGGYEFNSGFQGYIETTYDPGYAILVATILVCVASVVLVPIMVVLGERWEKKRRIQMEMEDTQRLLASHGHHKSEDKAVRYTTGVRGGGIVPAHDMQDVDLNASGGGGGGAPSPPNQHPEPIVSATVPPILDGGKKKKKTSKWLSSGGDKTSSSPRQQQQKQHNKHELVQVFSDDPEEIEAGLPGGISNRVMPSDPDPYGPQGYSPANRMTPYKSKSKGNNNTAVWETPASNNGVGIEASFQPPPDKIHVPLSRHFSPKATSTSVVSGATSAVSGITNNSLFKLNGVLTTAVDKLLIPQYPDDDEEFRSAVGGGGGGHHHGKVGVSRSTLGSVISAKSREELACDIHGRLPNVLDAGLAGGRRGRGHHKLGSAPGKQGNFHGAGTGGKVGRGFLQRNYLQSNSMEDENEIVPQDLFLSGKDVVGGHHNVSPSGRTEASESPQAAAAAGGSAAGQGEWGGDIESEVTGISSVLRRKQQGGGANTSTSAGGGRKTHGRTSNADYYSNNRGNSNIDDDDDDDIKSDLSWIKSTPVIDDISPNDAADADDPGKQPSFDMLDTHGGLGDITLFRGPHALWRWNTIRRGYHKLVDVSEYDKEMRRINRLVIPFVFDEMLETVLDFIDLALIGHYVGVDAQAAYAVIELFLDFTDELLGGIGDAESTLCPHALGSGNNFLAGQYVQISIVVFVTVSIPALLFWCFYIDQAILWLGLSAHVARIGVEYTRVAALEYIIDGVAESLIGLLEITGHEKYVALMDLIWGAIDITTLALVVTSRKVDLTIVALIHLCMAVGYALTTVGLAVFMGWYRQFIPALFTKCALLNRPALRNVIRTAVPLSIGNFLAYSEWEILTIFAASLGPAEVTVWALLASVWEIFEAATEGLGEAAAVRVSYHLGKGNPQMAKVSSYKCLLIGSFFGFFTTSIFFMCGENLAVWLTSDATLQNMLAELIPLVGLGNVTMTVGMTSWHIIGAQARYRLATLIALICSWFITLPLAAISVFALNIDLQGMVSAVVIGYSLTGSIMAYILLRTDWDRISDIIRGINAMTGAVDSDDSYVSASSSSSSSSSSSDDDSDDDELEDERNTRRPVPVEP